MGCQARSYNPFKTLVSAIESGDKKIQLSVEKLILSNNLLRESFLRDFVIADSETANMIFLRSDLPFFSC